MNKIIFFGTDLFAAHILDVMLKANIDVVAVVTKPDRKKHRNNKMLPPPCKQYCLDKGLDVPIFQPEKASTKEFAEVMRGFSPDLFVVVSYGEIINEELLAIPRLMPINIHPSALPKYRGASPLRAALLNGDNEIGIAIFEMVKAMDAGDVVAFEKLSVLGEENHSMLEKRVFEKAGELLLHCLDRFEKGDVVKQAQEGAPTFTKKFSKQDTKLSWEDGVNMCLCKIRAFGVTPGAFCDVVVGEQKLFLKILLARKVSSAKSSKIQTLTFDKANGWTIALEDGVIELLQVQLQNKKLMNVKDFINGMRGSAPVLS